MRYFDRSESSILPFQSLADITEVVRESFLDCSFQAQTSGPWRRDQDDFTYDTRHLQPPISAGRNWRC